MTSLFYGLLRMRWTLSFEKIAKNLVFVLKILVLIPCWYALIVLDYSSVAKITMLSFLAFVTVIIIIDHFFRYSDGTIKDGMMFCLMIVAGINILYFLTWAFSTLYKVITNATLTLLGSSVKTGDLITGNGRHFILPSFILALLILAFLINEFEKLKKTE